MANPMTEPLEPYEPAESDDYEWEYDQEQPGKTPVLWGRVALISAMLLASFFLGRLTESGGVPESELTKAETKIATLQQENEDLKSEVAAAETAAENAAPAPPADTATEPAGTEDSDAGAGETEVAGMNYTIKSGDTLTTIAKKFYNDPSLDNFLAEFNEISDPESLAVGQTIFLPDDTTPN